MVYTLLIWSHIIVCILQYTECVWSNMSVRWGEISRRNSLRHNFPIHLYIYRVLVVARGDSPCYLPDRRGFFRLLWHGLATLATTEEPKVVTPSTWVYEHRWTDGWSRWQSLLGCLLLCTAPVNSFCCTERENEQKGGFPLDWQHFFSRASKFIYTSHPHICVRLYFNASM